ncbi:hypothetical protein JJB07_01350 [Tumebacillus sp. ITR2]|uniref:Gram-positive cocci surface proteins LPxTG domain-containing protein n=1 Tax=Tumebacillus amylolyticus TaxID=2801339 RepID=A0ABS1J4S8_9BACL|nr:hypothetical protein [Tumebacillus amylolyticus]MBL0385278.1 hypothetical protein [Tumebacillus amylolyticus]
MKRILTTLFLVLFATCTLGLIQQPAFAGSPEPKIQYADQKVKSMVEADFQNYKNSLEHTKDNFGVTEQESYSKASLGDGVAYYDLANNSDLSADPLTFAGYVFPIHVQGKTGGIVFAQEKEGKWGVFYIQSNLTFEQDLAEAKKRIQADDSIKLVSDMSTALYAVSIESETGNSGILPMRDNLALGLKKNALIPKSEFQSQLKSLKAARESNKISSNNGKDNELIQMGGGFGTAQTAPTEQGATKNLLIGGGALIAGALSILALRRQKKQSESK